MLKRVQIPSPNHSSRSGAGVRLIVLHTAEGALTYQSLGSFFSSSSVQASSHSGADDTPGVIGQYVADSEKAWAVVAYNSVSVNLELCAFASWSRDEWMRHPQMLANAAAWVREEAAKFDIPIVKLTPVQAQGNGRGVCQHSDLGAAGGGHHDCGPGFPIDLVLEMAKADPHYDWFDDTPRTLSGHRLTERTVVQQYDKLRATQTATVHPNRVALAALRLYCRLLAGRVWNVAHNPLVNGKPTWDQFHRGFRRQGLIHRAQGQRVV